MGNYLLCCTMYSMCLFYIFIENLCHCNGCNNKFEFNDESLCSIKQVSLRLSTKTKHKKNYF